MGVTSQSSLGRGASRESAAPCRETAPPHGVDVSPGTPAVERDTSSPDSPSRTSASPRNPGGAAALGGLLVPPGQVPGSGGSPTVEMLPGDGHRGAYHTDHCPSDLPGSGLIAWTKEPT